MPLALFAGLALLALPALSPAQAPRPQDLLPETGLAPGAQAPALTALDEAGNPWALGAALKKGPVLLLFNRGHWCPFCQHELQALQAEVLPRARELGVELVALSVDSPGQNMKTRVRFGYEFSLLSVGEAQLAAFRVLNTEAKSSPRYAHPGIFILSKDGVVRWARSNKDYRKRPSPAEVLEGLERIGR